MKQLLAGCLVVLLVAMLGLGLAAYLGYRAARPVIDRASDYLARLGQLASVSDRIANKTPYTPPRNGELSAPQVDRFMAVQARVRDTLHDRWSALEATSAALRKKAEANKAPLSLAEVIGVFSDFTNIYVDARRAQVNALNVQKCSEGEYWWVRLRVYEAAGLHLAESIDLSAIESLARQGGGAGAVQMLDLPRPDVPPTNLALVKPHIARLRGLLPMAFLGL